MSDPNQEMEINAGSLMPRMTLHVHLSGLRVLRIRLWAAGKLIALAAWVAGCGLEISKEPYEDA